MWQCRHRPRADVDPANPSGRPNTSHGALILQTGVTQLKAAVRISPIAITAALVLVFSFISLAAPGAAGPIEDANAALADGDYETALPLVRSLAERGDAEAQHNSALCISMATVWSKATLRQ